MIRPGAVGTLLWALLCLLAATIVARATYTADLSAFLPRTPTATERLLVEQLREGPAARLIMAAVEGSDAGTRARLSMRLAAKLRSDRAFVAVNNGDAAQLERDRNFLFRYRYALSPGVTPQRFTVAGLHSAIGDSLDTLASPEGLLLKPLFPRDPTGELIGIIDSMQGQQTPHSSEGVWSSADGARALLVLQTRAAGSDTDGQQAACDAIRQAFASAVAAVAPSERAKVKLLLSGPPVFAIAARATIEEEVVRLSIVGLVLIAALLLAVYRSLPALALGFVPVASGALAGIAAVALKFGAVHGLTLGFGVTLIGEAVDYSIYLFIQRSGDFRQAVWPTIRLGMLTSICGFAALLPSAFPGLAQLGLYSVVGLAAAALVTRFILPAWAPQKIVIRDLTALGTRLLHACGGLRRARVGLLLVGSAALLLLFNHRGTLWNRELSALSPISATDQALDAQLRADVGAPDVRYMIVVNPAPDREGALAAANVVAARMLPLADQGVIGGFETPTRYLPEVQLQHARQASLPAPAELSERLSASLQGLPVSASLLQPFLLDVEAARTAALLTGANLAGTSFAAVVEGLLVKSGDRWVALLPVSGTGAGELSPAAAERLRTALPPGRAQLLNLKSEVDQLYWHYLSEAVQLALAGFAAIVILLWVALRSAVRMLRVVAPLALAVLCVAGLLAGLGQQLTILHVVGMLLIVAVGSNYALFFDRGGSDAHQGSLPLTLASLLVANLATVLAFGVLACSRVPVLADLGRTVAPGALLALIFSAALSRPAAVRQWSA